MSPLLWLSHCLQGKKYTMEEKGYTTYWVYMRMAGGCGDFRLDDVTQLVIKH